jgi:hypothetical protein
MHKLVHVLGSSANDHASMIWVVGQMETSRLMKTTKLAWFLATMVCFLNINYYLEEYINGS